MRIGPVTEIDVFDSAGTLGIEVQVPSRQQGNVKSWVRISRGVEQYAGQFIPKETEYQGSGAVLSPQSSTCGRPRAQTLGKQSQVRYKAMPKPKLISVAVSQRKMEDTPSKSKA